MKKTKEIIWEMIDRYSKWESKEILHQKLKDEKQNKANNRHT